MKNNKGVTLVELLIVIVVMGIIALFAVPAVSGILENVGKDKIVSEVIVVEEQLDIYCLDTTCTPGSTDVTWAEIEAYVDLDDTTYYVFGTTPATVVASMTADGTWDIIMEAATADDWEWIGSTGTAPDTVGQPTDYDTNKAKRAELTQH